MFFFLYPETKSLSIVSGVRKIHGLKGSHAKQIRSKLAGGNLGGPPRTAYNAVADC